MRQGLVSGSESVGFATAVSALKVSMSYTAQTFQPYYESHDPVVFVLAKTAQRKVQKEVSEEICKLIVFALAIAPPIFKIEFGLYVAPS